jgi:LmbE family N-acetylglucosaminyl deacetylase
MRAIRREEQREAARLGRYNLQIQLAHPSADVKRKDGAGLNADLDLIFGSVRPGTVYLHNPADSHDTHVALLLRCLEAIARLPAARRPARVLGCEVWRGLDWLLPGDKVALDAGADPGLARKLLAVFDSQVAGGKRYDEATLGRRAANATFSEPRVVDRALGVTFAIDLTPVTRPGGPSVLEHTLAQVERLKADVAERLRKYAP